MRLRYRLSKILLCAMLEFATLMGAPMRPEDLEELMQARRTVIEVAIPDRRDDPKKPSTGRQKS
jgi:hypothetical protein